MKILSYQSYFYLQTPPRQLQLQTPWRDLGGQVQQPQPPARPMKRAAVMAATGVFLVLTPPSQLAMQTPWRDLGGQVQQPQPPAKPLRKAAAMNATGLQLVAQPIGQLIPFVGLGGQVQNWQPPHYKPKVRWAAITRGDDGNEGLFSLTLALQTSAYPWHETPWVYPRKNFRSAEGMLLEGDDGISAIKINFNPAIDDSNWQVPYRKNFRSAEGMLLEGDDGIVAPLVVTSNFVPIIDSVWQPARKSWKINFIDSNDDTFFSPFYTTYSLDQQFQLPRRRWERAGFGGAFDVHPGTAPTVWGYDIQSFQMPRRRWERAGLGGGTEVYQFVASAALQTADYKWGYDIQSFQPRAKFKNYGALRSRSQFGFIIPAVWGWEVQHVQPPSPLRVRDRLAATKVKVQFAYTTPFVTWGWEVQPPPPPHPRPEKSAAIMRGHDGNEAIFSGTPVLLTASYPWHDEPWVYPSPLKARNDWAAIAPREDGIVFPRINFRDYGFAVQPIQPPHPRPERWASIAPKDDGIEATQPLGLQVGAYAWFETPWVYPSPLKARNDWAAIAPKDDGIQYPLLRWFVTGWEVQPIQPAHPRPERSGAIARGDDGNEGIYTFQVATIVYSWEQGGTQPHNPIWNRAAAFAPSSVIDANFNYWRNAGWEIQPVQPPHRGNEHRIAAILRGDEGNQLRYAQWINAGWEVQPVQPPHRAPERKGATLADGDRGNQNRFIFWRNAGWEVQPFQPPHRFVEKHGGILAGYLMPVEVLGQVIQPFFESVRFVIVDPEVRSITVDDVDDTVAVSLELRSITVDDVLDEVAEDDEDRSVSTDEEDRDIESTDL